MAESQAQGAGGAGHGGAPKARLGVAVLLLALAGGAWWTLQPASVGRAGVAAAGAAAPAASDSAAPTTAPPAEATVAVDPEEARQRDGRAAPGGPLGDGVAISVGPQVVGRMYPATAASTTLVALIADAEGDDDDLAAALEVAAALRKTRDYHLALLRAEAASSVEGLDAAVVAARAALSRSPLATVLLAARGSALAATSLVGRNPSLLALALISPTGSLDSTAADDAPWSGLRGRQVVLVTGERDPAAAPFGTALLRLPLGRTVRAASTRSGWPMLVDATRARSDLAGWLFAVTPVAK